jgi:endoglucanase
MLCTSVGLVFCAMSFAAVGAADGPTVVHIGTVAPNTIGITVQAGRVEYGRQVPYERQAGDELREQGKEREVWREGKFLGWLVGKEGRLVYTEDALVGEPLDTAWADRPGNYAVKSADDPDYAVGASPAAVHRKSKPSDFGRWRGWPYRAPVRHVIYLVLPRPLKEGARYSVSFGEGKLADQSLLYDPATTRSEAVHVGQTGFRPDDPAKVAFLSCWLGSGGPMKYADGLDFHVVDAATKERAFAGRARLVHALGDSEDAYNKDYAGTNVYELDFSGLRTPGTYRVCVDGIGCSYPFEISADVWRKAFTVSARGFYHQRSGIALGPPYTAFVRPRCFNPEDGVKVCASTCSLMDSGDGLNALGTDTGNFGNLVKGKTDQIVADAWGGYMDAGDWDRRIQHLVVTRYLLELAGLFPDYYAGLGLNIPESGNGLPDVVNEALFNLDCYRRMQTPDGGIRGGIESAEHPRQGEGSWQESLDVMAYAPDVWSSYLYAATAAQAAYLLQPTKSDLAATYRESALRAMEWAENHFPERKTYPSDVRDARNLAAAELLRLTGDPQWNTLFLRTTAFTKPDADLFVYRDHEQRDAAWTYGRTERPGMDEAIKANCRAAILREADDRAASTPHTSFRYAKYGWMPGGWGAFSGPDAVTLVRAHWLTDDEKYLKAAVLACQMGLGANPANVCYTTGLGQDWARHPLHIDSRISGQEPPPGLTVFGPRDVAADKGHWAQQIVAGYCYPDVQQWPTLEAFWDVFWYPEISEFTVQGPMAPNAYVWGYLAARGQR